MIVPSQNQIWFSMKLYFNVIILNLLGQPSTSADVDDLVSQLRHSEEQISDLKERLKTTTSNVEQYHAMVVNLEESLNKEKQVMSTAC